MKKLLIILPVLFIALATNAQQTEDEVYVGKKFGNYKGTGGIVSDGNHKVKPANGQTTLTGMVVSVGWCEEDCRTISVKKDDGTIVTVGTKDYGFAVPRKIVGRKITIEGIESVTFIRERKAIKKEYQKDIQLTATGIKIIN